jgi:hypothetical protein
MVDDSGIEVLRGKRKGAKNKKRKTKGSVAITLTLPIRSRHQALRHVPAFSVAAISPELIQRAEIISYKPGFRY